MKRFAGVLVMFSIAAAIAWTVQRMYLARTAAGPVSARATGAPASLDPIDALEPGIVAGRPIPEQLPAFTLRDRDGQQTPISTWRGKSLIINFWATWCAPCRREMPLLQSLDRNWAGQDFRVIGIAVDRRDAVLAFANSLHIGYPLLIGEQEALDVAASLGVPSPGLPFTVFTDRRGQIVALYFGELHRAQTDLILSVVLQVNQDRLALADARRKIGEELAKLKTAGRV
ncbi:MAG: TlpA family protein disulfide reductase [Steroidobacterales bacterium]